MDITEAIKAHLSSIAGAPFLFIGSGISRRYLNVDDWSALLQRFATPLPQPFAYYHSKANGSLAATASEMAPDYHEYWFKSGSYHPVNSATETSIASIEMPLKIAIAQYIKERDIGAIVDEDLQNEIAILQQVTVDGVITTNWDQFCEHIFPDYEVFIGQDNLLFSNPQSIAEIYKIHGCCSRPESMVLTKEDYDTFHNRNPYLAAKLLSVFIEHPVFFLGYSLSDPDILTILNSIASCLTSENLAKLKDRLIFVQRDKDSEGEDVYPSIIVTDGKSLPVTVVRTNNFAGVYTALGQVQRRFPAKLLRQLKEHVYDLVLTNDSNGRMFVADLESCENPAKVEVVYGVGVGSRYAQTGYEPVTTADLLKDILVLDSAYDSDKIVQHVLPRLLKASRFVPMFKYLRASRYIENKSVCRMEELDNRIVSLIYKDATFFFPPAWDLKKMPEIRGLQEGINELALRYAPEKMIVYIPLIELARVSSEELRAFLIEHEDMISVPKLKSNYSKLVCYYDWLSFGRDIGVSSLDSSLTVDSQTMNLFDQSRTY